MPPRNDDATWVDVLPSLARFTPELNKALKGVMPKAGQQAGADYAESFTRAAAAGVEKASDRLAAARNKELDAAGRLTIAEKRLQELQETGRAKASQLAAAQEQVARAQRQVADTMEASERAARGLATAQERAKDAAKELGNANGDLASSLRRSGDSSGEGFAASFGSKMKAGLAGAALAAGAAIFQGIQQGIENERASDRLAAQLGLSPEGQQVAGRVAGRLYRDAYGESLGEVNEAIGAVMSSIQGMRGATEEELEAATATVLDFASAFGVDVNTATQTAGQLIRNGFAADATEAFDLLTEAFQSVPAAMREELPDILNEYGTNFRALGFNGEQAFGLLVRAAQDGQFSLDKTGDALKEFSIRATDMSESSVGAYQRIGLNAGEMANAILAGGDVAREATTRIAQGILSIEDPAERANTAIALFGTPLEDLSVDQIPQFLQVLSSADQGLESVGGSAAAMGATLNDNLGTRLEGVKRQAMGFVTDGIGALIGGFTGAGTATDGWAKKFQDAGAWIRRVWSDTLQPMFRDLWVTVQDLWTRVIDPILTWIGEHWSEISATIAFAWNYVFKPALTNTASVIIWLWEQIARPIFTFIGEHWDEVARAIQWVYNTILKPTWDAVAGTVRGLWDNVLRPIFGFIGSSWDTLGRGLRWVYDTIISPVWGALVTGVEWARDRFRDAVRWIGLIWDGIKEALMAPVRFVVDAVWNNGLMRLWNWINNIWGGTDLQPFRLASGGVIPSGSGFLGTGASVLTRADGGILPGYTPGRDVHRFYSPTGGLLDLSGGEAVMRPEFTRALGPATIDRWNALARQEGVAGLHRALSGGAWSQEGRPPRHQAHAPGGIIQLGDRGLGFLDTALGAAEIASYLVPGGALLNLGVSEIRDRVRDYVRQENEATQDRDGSPWGQALGGTARNAANEAWTKLKDLITPDMTAAFKNFGPENAAANGGSFPKRTTGWPPRRSGVVSPNTATAVAAIRAAFPQIRSIGTVGSRPNASDHPMGKALDAMIPGWNTPGGKALGYQVADFLARNSLNWGLNYLIFDDKISMGAGWRPYTHPNGATANPTLRHLDHVHGSFFDQGGLWNPGVMGFNTTGGIERVLTPPQDDYFRRRVELDERRDAAVTTFQHDTVVQANADAVAIAREIDRNNLRRERQALAGVR